MSTKQIKISDKISLGLNTDKLLLIAGPCQIESLEHCLMIATYLLELEKKYPINVVFKASYDKANRTSLKGQRGLGIDQGLEILAQTKIKTGLPILTDVHSVEDVNTVAEVVDVIQIPAFLCRQTDLLLAAGKTNKAINVKKGQFLAPHDTQFIIEKIASTGNTNTMLCERGTCFGYRDLIVDMRGLHIMNSFNQPVIFDATHSVQQMGGSGGVSGGNREYILPLSRAALAVGVHGIFVECHQDPDNAPSDGPNMLALSQMSDYVKMCCNFRKAFLEI